jgi:glycosyltransferase involved in cell wall biosynthesis
MKKKVTIVTTVPSTLKNILKNQPKYLSKHFAISIVTSPDKEIEDVRENENVPIYCIGMKRDISLLNDMLSLVKMIWVIVKIKPDIIHSYTPKAGLLTMLAGFICRVPVRLHTFTGLIFPTSTGIRKKILILIDRLICFCATDVIPEGTGVKRDLLKFGITKKTLDIIGCGNIAGVNTDFYDKDSVINKGEHLALVNQLKLPDEAFVFCFVGRLTKDKGIIELLDAFKKMPSNVYLLLVGELDKRAPLSLAAINFIEQASNIHYLGYQKDIRPALTIAKVLLLPSYREGFPNVPLQAGSMKLPSIVSDINGCNEIIIPNINGWLVPAKDSQALASAMQDSINFNELERLGENARELVKTNFEQKAHWKNMELYYTEKLVKTSSE